MAEERDWLAPLWDLLSVMSPAEAEAKVVSRDPQAHRLMEAMARGDVMPEGQEPDPLVGGRFDPERKQLYQQIFEAAQKRPETTTVGMTRTNPGGIEQASGMYDPRTKDITIREYSPYYSRGSPLRYRGTDGRLYFTDIPGKRYTSVVPTALTYQDTLAHELVHFLLPQIQRDLPVPAYQRLFPGLEPRLRPAVYDALLSDAIGNPEAQHRFIRYLLGSSEKVAETAIPGADQPSNVEVASHPSFLGSHSPPFSEVSDIWSQVLQRMLTDPQLRWRALAPLQSAPVGR